jgi:LPXTG-site transpeptidase (sortase) family protein
VSRGRHRRRWYTGRAALAGAVVLLAVGGFLVVRAVTDKPQQPPMAAQVIPRSVPTAVPVQPSAPASSAAKKAARLAVSRPVRLVIPAISVNAPVESLGLNPDKTVQVPALGNHNLAGWYDGSVTPGQAGPSVILGHVDNYQGASVFFSLKNLVKGDAVDVMLADGKTVKFTVDGVQKVSKTSFPSMEVYGMTSYPALRLVTCGGVFDSSTGSYVDSIIVYAHMV